MQFGLSELILFQITGKGNSWEGGIRVPTVVSWPSHLPQGIEISEPTNSFDIFPTLLEIAGAEPPKDRVIDGKTLMSLLTRQTNITSHEIMIHYCAKAIHAVRYRPRTGKTVWKTHFMTPKFTPGTEGCFGHAVCHCYGDAVTVHDPPLLFDLTDDPSESRPILLDDHRYKPVIDAISKAIDEHKQSVVEVPSELDSYLLSPWRQVCCNPPWCSCKENVTMATDYLP